MREHVPARLFSNRRLLLAVLATVFVIILVSAAKTGSQPPIVLAVSAAANRTLGFGSIQMISLPIRQDKADAATVQSFLSKIDIQIVEGVNGSRLGEVGLPPSSIPDTEPGQALSAGEKGCWRSHANVRTLGRMKPMPNLLTSDLLGMERSAAHRRGDCLDLGRRRHLGHPYQRRHAPRSIPFARSFEWNWAAWPQPDAKLRRTGSGRSVAQQHVGFDYLRPLR